MKGTRGRLKALAVLAGVILLVAACSSDNKTTASNSSASASGGGGAAPSRGNVDGTLKVGALLPATGDLAAISKSLTTPVQMAVDEINQAGGVLGKPMQKVDADDGTSPDVAGPAFDKLVNSDKVDTIIGPASSGTTKGILDKIKNDGVVACSGSATSAELTTLDDGGFFFRTAPPDKLQGPALAQRILKDGNTAVAIMVRNDSYGTGFASFLAPALEKGGAKVVANVAYDPSSATFDSDVQKVKDGAPDAVVVIGFQDDGGKVVNTLIQKGLGPSQIALYTADGMQDKGFFKKVDPNNPAVVQGMKGTAPAGAPTAGSGSFSTKFASTGLTPIFSAYYYDCTIITALAAEEAKSDDSAKIKDHMVDVTRDGTKCTSYADCKALIDQGKDIDYDGASGPLEFSPVGEPTVASYDQWSYDATGAVVTDAQQIVAKES